MTKADVCIIGGGFYGCNLAIKLCNDYGLKVDLFEASEQILKGAISNNQHRLHLGFHYPRSIETIKQTITCFGLFREEYGQFCKRNSENIYIVHEDSLVDSKSFYKIYNDLNLRCDAVETKIVSKFLNKKQKYQQAFSVDEESIDIHNMNSNIYDKIKNLNQNGYINIFTSKRITHEEILNLRNEYKFVFNCTYTEPFIGFKELKIKSKWEVCGIPVMNDINNFFNNISLTIMDGPFCSLYNCNNGNLFTLSSVKHTPFYKTNNFSDALQKLKDTKANSLNLARYSSDIINHNCEFYNKEIILNECKITDFYLTIKCKLEKDIGDLRTSSLFIEENYFSIMAGKISAFYEIYNRLQNFIKR